MISNRMVLEPEPTLMVPHPHMDSTILVCGDEIMGSRYQSAVINRNDLMDNSGRTVSHFELKFLF